MSSFVYNLSILLYRLALALASPFNQKAQKLRLGKRNWKEDLELLPSTTKKRVWFHCASLGEFEQGRPLIEELKERNPDYSIVLTFFSPSGYELRKNYKMADKVCYLPWDTKSNARDFYNLVKPDLAVFVKYEFWKNLLAEGKRREVPNVLVSGIFRPSQLFFKSYGNSYRKILNSFDHFFLQNVESVDLLGSIGLRNTTLAGDTRFDRVFKISEETEEIPEVKVFAKNSKVLVAGSVWPDDMQRLIPVINDESINLKFILAPHEINEGDISRYKELIKEPVVLYSEISNETGANSKVLIIDNVGLLSRLYRYGYIAFIGGAYRRGLHNILEAAAFGQPVFFGNENYTKYQEAIDLIQEGAAQAVEDVNELKTGIKKFMDSEELYNKASLIAKKYILDNKGASNLILEYLTKRLSSK